MLKDGICVIPLAYSISNAFFPDCAYYVIHDVSYALSLSFSISLASNLAAMAVEVFKTRSYHSMLNERHFLVI